MNQMRVLTDEEIQQIKNNLVARSISTWQYNREYEQQINKNKKWQTYIVSCVKEFENFAVKYRAMAAVYVFLVLCITFCVSFFGAGIFCAYSTPTSSWGQFFFGTFVPDSTAVSNIELVESMEVNDTPSPITTVDDSQNYYRNMLDASMKTSYDQLYKALENREQNIFLSDDIDHDKLNLLITCVLSDHPELFWFDGLGNFNKRTKEFIPTYECTEDEIYNIEQSLSDAVDNIYIQFDLDAALGANEHNTLYKAQVVADYICDITTYNMDAAHNQSLYSVFSSGETVCAGYSKAMVYLCREIGIPAIYMFGDAYGDIVNDGRELLGRHAWVMFIDDGIPRYCDPTWYDNNDWGRNYSMFDADANFTDTHKTWLRS